MILWASQAGGKQEKGEIKWLLGFSVSSAHVPVSESKLNFLQTEELLLPCFSMTSSWLQA